MKQIPAPIGKNCPPFSDSPLYNSSMHILTNYKNNLPHFPPGGGGGVLIRKRYTPASMAMWDPYPYWHKKKNKQNQQKRKSLANKKRKSVAL